MEERPWIILTMRRTGGTSLTGFLSATSSFESVEHEPFNVERIFGEITREYIKNRNEKEMVSRVKSALGTPVNIKHCFDIIPTCINKAIIDICLEKNYRFIYLSRRSERKRLLSLALAKATGAWGAAGAAEIYPQIRTGERQAEPIVPAEFLQRAQVDYQKTGQVLNMLRNRSVKYDWVVFEELYFGSKSIKKEAIKLAAGHGVTVKADDPALELFSSMTGQKSLSISDFVYGYEETSNLLFDVCVE